MSGYRIRRATTADCGLIHALAEKVFPDTYREILSPEQLDYMMEWMYSLENLRRQMEEEGHVYFIASDNEGIPCGYVSVQPQEADLFHLQKIYVLPAYQGKHCGSFLFREALRYIRDVHPSPCRVELNVNRHNKALLFYERMGMRKLREGDFPIGNGYYMNDYIMGLELDTSEG
ncbi:MAG: GNAT family N-acetyltransferase [Mediterranea sp.]|jgi:ribosomal protein S18 acetylase RimI-like enzyme|nr:GNAT family N-acetyltransferase [Mediterranea sp.]